MFFIKNALSSSDWIESFNNRQERHLTTGGPGPDHISTSGVLTLPSLEQVQDGYCHVWGNKYAPPWRVWFSSSLLWDGVYKSESLGLELGIIFQETDQLFKDFSLD